MFYLDEHPLLHKIQESVHDHLAEMIAIGSLLALLGVQHYVAGKEQSLANTTYSQQYLGRVGCLRDTAFDPDKGATVHLSGIHDTDIITIDPRRQDAGILTPLHFGWSDRGIDPSDQRTLDTLTHYGCPTSKGE